jgi:hypothetical protein
MDRVAFPGFHPGLWCIAPMGHRPLFPILLPAKLICKPLHFICQSYSVPVPLCPGSSISGFIYFRIHLFPGSSISGFIYVPVPLCPKETDIEDTDDQSPRPNGAIQPSPGQRPGGSPHQFSRPEGAAQRLAIPGARDLTIPSWLDALSRPVGAAEWIGLRSRGFTPGFGVSPRWGTDPCSQFFCPPN